MHSPNAKLRRALLFALVLALGLIIVYLQINGVGKENIPIPLPTPQISGNTADLVSFSIHPGADVSGIIDAAGSVRGGYFFEGNIVVKVLDAKKNVLKSGNGTATTDWMTADPVSFTTTVDFAGLPAGDGFIRLQNDNPSGDPANEKHIDIPIQFK